MHLGFITTEYPSPGRPEGGLANYVSRMRQLLAARGHASTVFVVGPRRSSGEAGASDAVSAREFRFPAWLHRRRFLWVVLPALERVISARRLRRVVLDHHGRDPLDIVQTPNYLAPGIALAGNGRFPIVCRLSSFAPALRAAAGDPHDLGRDLVEWLEEAAAVRADAIFSPSRFVASMFGRLAGVPARVIPTPLPAPPPEGDGGSELAGVLANREYLVYCGGPARHKGADLLLDAAPSLLDRYPDLVLVFMGFHDVDRLRPGARTSWDRIAGSPRVVAGAPLPSARLFSVIAGARGVIVPSLVDNYPNVALEAVAAGVPVIGSRESSLDEIVVDGVTGFLADNGSSSSLVRAIAALMDLGATARQAMTVAIRERRDELLAADPVGQAVSLYEEVISRFRSGAAARARS